MHRLSIEHHTQEVGGGCLAACVQMVLANLGVKQSQRRLNQILGLTSIGVPYTNIVRLTRLGVQVVIDKGNQNQVQRLIEQGLPIIAFLFTGDLSYWQVNTSHAVVIVGFDQTYCYLHDPAFVSAPQLVQWDEFLLAWGEMDYAYAIITR
jgi:ABC-type bacteriocin/lantibiotic exporter with double-glycine peptidase domain